MNLKIILVAVISLTIGIVGTYLLLSVFSSDSVTVEHAHVDEEGQLWTCGMHPDIILDEPGDCPICGMKLVPLNDTQSSSASGEKEILYWRAPMDPNEIYDEPGKSKMGMDLVPVYADEAGASGVVKIDPVVVQNMNVKTEKVTTRNLSNEVSTNAVLSTNESTDYTVSTRVNGWVENLYINYTGQIVKKGEKLLDIYSPELVSTQEELLTAINYQKATSSSSVSRIMESGDILIENAMEKLRLLEIPETDIENLIKTGKTKTYMSLYAPYSGTVMHKNVIEGQKISAGMSLLQISNLNKLWLYADIYEYELALVTLGSKAKINFNFMPGKTYNGEVDFIYPTIDPKTRTAKVGINIKNTGGELKPAMLANVTIQGKNLGTYPTVPEEAILRGGRNDIVIVALGEGKFKPQPVKLGAYADGYYQILEGLSEGTEFVTSAQFLIDSESNLKAAVKKFSSSKKGEADKDMKMNKDDSMSKQSDQMSGDKNMKMEGESHDAEESELIRKGVIDLEAIDENKDGKVFQDVMDWNVISDKPGKCPICGMTLQEFTLEETKKNLEEHGFKAKEIGAHSDTGHSNEHGIDSPLIRTGMIDLKAIDKNNDGKVYQDFMDWNVISDEPGRCPVCNMILQEVSLEKAKSNLIEHGYQVK